MTRSERLWKDGKKFWCNLPGMGRIVSYQEMNSTPCTYFDTVTALVNGVAVRVDIYYFDHKQGYIGVICDRKDAIKVCFHRITE